MKWFKYTDVFLGEGKIDHEIHKQIGAVTLALYWTVIVRFQPQPMIMSFAFTGKLYERS